MTVASRIAVMDEGRIVQVATPDQIYEMPASVYVADFIGDVTILTGTAHPAGDGLFHVQYADNHPPLVAASDRPFTDGQSCHFAIRPEKITIHADLPNDVDNAVAGKVLDIAYLGNLSTYHVELPGGQIIKAQMANTRRLSRRDITWDDDVWVSWTKTAGVLLDT